MFERGRWRYRMDQYYKQSDSESRRYIAVL